MSETPVPSNRITVRAAILGIFFSAAFAVLSSWFENRRQIFVTSTQIAILPYVLLLGMVLLINPVCRLIRIVRQFAVAEILTVFVMCSVSAGLSTFGLASYLIPIIGDLFNKEMSDPQERRDLYVEASLNDAFFLSEPGIQDAAKKLRAVEIPLQQIQRTRAAAESLLDAEAKFRQTETELKEADKVPRESDRIVARRAAAYEYSSAQLTLKGARREWEACASPADPQSVIDKSGPVIAALKEKTIQRKAELRELEDRSAEKAAVFHKGLPEKMRAIPGFIPIPGESIQEYLRRTKRLTHGIAAVHDLQAAQKTVESAPADAPLSPEIIQQVNASIASAVGRLETIADAGDLDAAKEAIEQQKRDEDEQGKALLANLSDLREERRNSNFKEAEEIQKKIRSLEEKVRKITSHEPVYTDRLKAIEEERKPILYVQAAVASLHAIEAKLQQKPPPASTDIQADLASTLAQFPSFDASMKRFLIGDVPWLQWIKPLLNWSVSIILTFTVLMTLNILLFRQWAHNEKLMYPLAKLPEVLAGGDEDTIGGGMPSIFKSGLFWVGLGVSGGIMGWNLFSAAMGSGDIKPIPLTYSWNDYTVGTIFAPVSGTRMQFFFTLIGIAFMIPSRISFSLWFFYILLLVQILNLNWMGYPPSPPDWWLSFNFQTAQASGGLIIFAAVVVWKCRRYLLCGFRPSLVGDLASPERLELRWASLLFLFASVGLVLSLWLQMGATLGYTVIFFLLMLAFTISLTRAIAEGGLLGFQIWANPFHYIKTFFGIGSSGPVPGGVAPLLTYYCMLFFDGKALISPTMANSLKIRDDARIGRFRFYTLIFICMALAAVVAIAVHLMLAYEKGGINGSSIYWFPRDLFGHISGMDSSPLPPDPSSQWWLAFGGIFMVVLLFTRRFFLWLPHPIGFMMLCNKGIENQWFSIFIGWLVRSLVNKYGNKDTYTKARQFFIGLIIGELVIVILAMILVQSGINLNGVKFDLNH